MKLVIVESPTKSKTIGGFLKDGYKIESSYGHVRYLPKGNIGIDVEANFEPKYVIPTKSRKRVNALKKLAEKADSIILATDEDREGEAIAFHLMRALELNEKQVERIVFHEITEGAIAKALVNPRGINMDLVNAQQARRVLDRLVGYNLSPFLWKKVANRLSAGRVQSVTLRFIADREEEIRRFKPEKYWTIEALFGTKKSKNEFIADLYKIDGNPLPKPGINDKKKVDKVLEDLKKSSFVVSSVARKELKRKPPTPFITSTLQQEASKRLYFSVKQTMRFAQALYENGLITYMRTDSLHLSEESLSAARVWIKKELGNNYVLNSPRRFKTKSRLAQEAHEAIRPTNPSLRPEDLNGAETKESKLYDLIWRRFIGSQLPEAVFDRTTIDISASGTEENYTLRTVGTILRFDGFLKIWHQKFSENEAPSIDKGDELNAREIKSVKHETDPPPRYNEASLIKVLEENGIGRPSTYAPTISVIQDRNYVEKNEARRFQPTKIGELVNKVLTEHFPKIVDVNFTARMEEDLDKIAEGRKDWHEVIREFYEPFKKNLDEKYEEVSKIDIVGEPEKTDEVCGKCGKPMTVKTSRFGKFLGCSGFPECKNTKSFAGSSNAVIGNDGKLMKCLKCNDGDIVRKRTKRGKFFYGCTKGHACDYASWKKPGSDDE